MPSASVFALLAGEIATNVRRACFEQVGRLAQNVAPGWGGHCAPGREGLARSFHRVRGEMAVSLKHIRHHFRRARGIEVVAYSTTIAASTANVGTQHGHVILLDRVV
jgi:hypothetical protein